jgi:hypothetical protein
MPKWPIYLTSSVLLVLSDCGRATPGTNSAPVFETDTPVPAPGLATPGDSAANAPSPEATETQVETAPVAATLVQTDPQPEEPALTATLTEPPTANVNPTDPPQAAEGPAPTATSDWLTVEGKTAENYTYLGNPEAPITLIDYSDFM